MPDALLFDFDGVVIDSEPIHLACFRAVLAERGIPLTDEDYYARYVGFDDHDCFEAVFRDNGREAGADEIATMTAEKTRQVQAALGGSIEALPGTIELMRAAREARVPAAICSGALREEIELAGRTVGATALVDVLVAAMDVTHGKPDPEGYLLAMKLLGEVHGRAIDPARTWVFEDTPPGIAAGKAAGCKVVGIMSSYTREDLAAADLVVESLAEVNLNDLE